MEAYVKAALIVSVAVAFVVFRSRAKATKSSTSAQVSDWEDGELEQKLLHSPSQSPQVARLNLTELQKVALTSASLGYTLYAEGRFQPGPDELEIYSARTVDSLVKRGFLASNDSGGYVITQTGSERLKRSYGY